MADSSRVLRGREWMLFVDGENFTKRGQAVLGAAGVAPIPGEYWLKDVFIWLPERAAQSPFIVPPGITTAVTTPSAIRSYFYTSQAQSTDQDLRNTKLALRNIGFEPRLYQRRQERSKGVDIGLTTEVLILGAQGRYQVAVIFAGDGDYVPLVEAVKGFGMYVVVGFFEQEGLSPDLRIAADEFVDVTRVFTESWSTWVESQTRSGRPDDAPTAGVPSTLDTGDRT